MKISDEQLSAFLDAELSEAQMQQVRDALAEDEQLANRLANLAMADNLVAEHARLGTDSAIPSRITRLLEDPVPDHRVVQLSAWRRMLQPLQGQTALAAGVALVVGIGLAQYLPLNGQTLEKGHWTHIARVLDTQRSGQTWQQEQLQVTPRLSFVNQQGQYCRQFSASTADETSEQLACRNDRGQWQQVAYYRTNAQHPSDEYQTATAAHALDGVLDQMMASAPLNAEQEKQAIAGQWRTSN